MLVTRALRGLVAAVMAAALGWVPVSTAFACSCMEATIAESVGFADVVFTGTVVAVEMPPAGEVVNTMDPVHYSFAVEKVFKGPLTEAEVVASTAMDGASCGTEFGIDERWLVFANFAEQGISTGLCSGNVPLVDPESEDAVVAELGEPIAEPVATEPASEEVGFAVPIALVVGGVLAAAVVGFSFWAFVREPRRSVR